MALVKYRQNIAGITGLNRPLTITEVDENFYNINTELAQKATNAFSTISVSGQSNVIADTASDTLTLVAGSGINITTDANTDSITLSVQNAGAISLAADDSAITQYLVFASGPGVQSLKIDPTTTALSYVPSTSTLTASSIILTGSVSSAEYTVPAGTTTANIINSIATTINFASNSSTFNLGSSTSSAQSVNLFSSSTGSSTYNIATGPTANTNTKTVNFATGGTAGSATAVNIGSSAGGSTTINSPDVLINGNLTVNGNIFSETTAAVTTNALSAQDIISRSASTFRSVKYLIQAHQGTNYGITNIVAVHDGSAVQFVESGSALIGTQLGTYDVSIVAGNIVLQVTPNQTTATTFKVKAEYITA